jgi:hypothetical protein
MDVTDCKVGVRYSDLACAASKRCVMSRKLRQVQTDTLRRVVKYLGGRETPPPSIDDTQPMEGTEAIGGTESEDATYLRALLPSSSSRPRASSWKKQKWVGPPGNGSSNPMRMRPALVRRPDGKDRPLPALREDGGHRTDRLSIGPPSSFRWLQRHQGERWGHVRRARWLRNGA